MELGGKLAGPIDSTSTRQVAQDTVLFLRARGREPQRFPSDTALKIGRRLMPTQHYGAGRHPIVQRVTEATDPSKVPLAQTPKKRVNEGFDTDVLMATGEASSYMRDSRMVTPRSPSRSGRLADETESLRPTLNTRQETGRRDFDYLDGGLADEWARQIRVFSTAGIKSFTPRRELVTHLPLGNINPILNFGTISQHPSNGT
ncbi:Hypothetical protein PHPALM_12109 [Phytophthora palmivora]|uniref:Uncharacterized protein n=1 Tax=Phytophthora palmivora TaxID=4796 RepID=A0A2P4Y0I7_9STRA|nr:Hypothetical protein PHPALM_12109 [Phytophthora palmivora]